MHCSTSDQETDWSFEVHNISSRGNLLADRLPIIHPPLYNPGDSPNTARFRRVRPLLPKGAFRYPRMSRGGDFVRTYEVMTIYRPELAETEVRTAVAEMEELLRSRGAEITESCLWQTACSVTKSSVRTDDPNGVSHPPVIVMPTVGRKS